MNNYKRLQASATACYNNPHVAFQNGEAAKEVIFFHSCIFNLHLFLELNGKLHYYQIEIDFV